MQLSLSYTMADLDDILPPGSYELDLVDRAGTPLGLTVDVEIGTLRNAGVSESQDLEDGPVALSAGGSALPARSQRSLDAAGVPAQPADARSGAPRAGSG